MTALSEDDEELLELAVLKVPWYMVCGDFHHRYGSARALSQRLLELRDAGLLTITPRGAGGTSVSAEILEADALSNDCYEDFDASWEPKWDILITEKGYGAIKERLKEQ